MTVNKIIKNKIFIRNENKTKNILIDIWGKNIMLQKLDEEKNNNLDNAKVESINSRKLL